MFSQYKVDFVTQSELSIAGRAKMLNFPVIEHGRQQKHRIGRPEYDIKLEEHKKCPPLNYYVLSVEDPNPKARQESRFLPESQIDALTHFLPTSNNSIKMHI